MIFLLFARRRNVALQSKFISSKNQNYAFICSPTNTTKPTTTNVEYRDIQTTTQRLKQPITHTQKHETIGSCTLILCDSRLFTIGLRSHLPLSVAIEPGSPSGGVQQASRWVEIQKSTSTFTVSVQSHCAQHAKQSRFSILAQTWTGVWYGAWQECTFDVISFLCEKTILRRFLPLWWYGMQRVFFG